MVTVKILENKLGSFYQSLLEATKYDEMFTTLLNAFPDEYKTRIKRVVENAISWARKTLKKQDRIIWYLRLFRGQIIKEQEKLLQKSSFVNSVGKLKINSLENTNINKIKVTLEHYFSLNLPGIDNYIFDRQTPEQVFEFFKSVEEEWQEKIASDDSNSYLESDPTHTVVIQFQDGSAWWNLNKAYCDKEGKAMGHCGNAGTPKDGDKVLSFRKQIIKGGKRYLVPYMTFILDKNGYLGEMKGRANDKPVSRYHQYIIALLKDDCVKGIKGGGYMPESNFSLDDLPQGIKLGLIKDKPELGSPKDLYEIYGDKEVTRKSVIKHSEALGIDVKWDDDANGFVIETWKNVDSMLEEKGDKIAQYVAGVMNGSETFDVDYNTSKEQREDFLDVFQRKNSEIYQKIVDYVKSEYADDLEEDEEPSNREIITILYDNNDDIYDQIGWAILDGDRVGAEREMYRTLVHVLENSDLTFTKAKDKDGKEHIDWDSLVKFALSTKQMVQKLSSDEEDFVEELDEFTIKLDEPYYGWQGFDEDAAVEHFANLMSEHFYEPSQMAAESLELIRLKTLIESINQR